MTIDNILRAVGIVFHPLLMATYSCLLFYFIFPQVFSPIPYDDILHFVGVVFLTTFIIPAISIYFLKVTNRISSLELTRREERILPFLTITGFYGITTFLLIKKVHISDQLSTMMFVVTLLIGLILLISMKYKISVHAAGIWGTFGTFSGFAIKYLTTASIYYLIGLVSIAGVVCFSRLYLRKHTSDEVWSGAILGFILCFGAIYLFA